MSDSRCAQSETTDPNPMPRPAPALSATALRAKEVYAVRRKRDRTFADPALFADPAWDILLSLFIDEAEGHAVMILAACAAAHVPTSTAIRWLRKLERDGFITTVADPRDARRRYVTLLPKARDALHAALG